MPEHNCCLAIDAMGGDAGPRLVVPAVLSSLRRLPRLRCQLYGNEAFLLPLLEKAGSDISARVQVFHAPQEVLMEDKPALALRHKRDSSLWHAIAAVARGDAQACVSGGNTGALMAMGMSLIGTLPGIERPLFVQHCRLPEARPTFSTWAQI